MTEIFAPICNLGDGSRFGEYLPFMPTGHAALRKAAAEAVTAGARGLIIDYPQVPKNVPGRVIVHMGKTYEQVRADHPDLPIGFRVPPLAWEFDSLGRSKRHALYVRRSADSAMRAFAALKPDFVCIEPLTVDTALRSWVLPAPELVRGLTPLVEAGIAVALPRLESAASPVMAVLQAHFGPAGHFLLDALDVSALRQSGRMEWAARWLRVNPLRPQFPTGAGGAGVVLRAGLGDEPMQNGWKFYQSNAAIMTLLVNAGLAAGWTLATAEQAKALVLGAAGGADA